MTRGTTDWVPIVPAFGGRRSVGPVSKVGTLDDQQDVSALSIEWLCTAKELYRIPYQGTLDNYEFSEGLRNGEGNFDRLTLRVVSCCELSGINPSALNRVSGLVSQSLSASACADAPPELEIEMEEPDPEEFERACAEAAKVLRQLAPKTRESPNNHPLDESPVSSQPALRVILHELQEARRNAKPSGDGLQAVREVIDKHPEGVTSAKISEKT